MKQKCLQNLISKCEKAVNNGDMWTILSTYTSVLRKKAFNESFYESKLIVTLIKDVFHFLSIYRWFRYCRLKCFEMKGLLGFREEEKKYGCQSCIGLVPCYSFANLLFYRRNSANGYHIFGGCYETGKKLLLL